MKYSLSPREIPRAKPKRFPKGSDYTIVYPDSSHNTDILPSRLSNSGEVNFDIIIFIN